MTVLTYQPGGAFLVKIMAMKPEEVQILCPVCGNPVIYAPTFEAAKRLGIHPGLLCPTDPRHLKVMFHLKPPPETP